MLVSFEEWERVSKVPSFAELLLAFSGEPGDIPERSPQTGSILARQSGLTLYLLGTSLVSGDASDKRSIDPGTFAAWIRRNGERLFISAITVAEIEAGIMISGSAPQRKASGCGAGLPPSNIFTRDAS